MRVVSVLAKCMVSVSVGLAKNIPIFLLRAMHLQLRAKKGFAKFRLAEFRGIKRENFIFHLKETEFIYNTKKALIHKTTLE